MKRAACTLIDIEVRLRAGISALVVLRRFAFINELLALMTRELSVLVTMSPGAYAEIRRGLG